MTNLLVSSRSRTDIFQISNTREQKHKIKPTSVIAYHVLHIISGKVAIKGFRNREEFARYDVARRCHLRGDVVAIFDVLLKRVRR